MGVLTENHGLYLRMRAEEYLEFFGKLYGMTPSASRARGAQWLEHFGMADAMDKRLGEYSKGMRQKLALIRAVLHDPPVLLLDEPTSAMDPESARLVRDAIHTLRSEDRTIVICTHNLAEAEELADKLAIIRRGMIIAQGSPQGLKARMLGPEEFEIRLAIHLNGSQPVLPGGVEFTSSGPDWIRYRTKDPTQANPLVLQALVTQGLPVITLQEVPRSLEQVYLQAISVANPEEVLHGE